MKKRLFSLVSLLLALGAFTTALADDKPKTEEKPKAVEKADVDEKLAAVEKELSKVWGNLKSLTADLEMEMTMQGLPTKSKGKVEFVNHPDKELLRMEMKIEIDMGGQTMESTMSTIYDGEFVYLIKEMMGQTIAVKQKPGAISQSPGGRHMFESLKAQNTLKVLPNEKVDGKDAFVIEATPNSSLPLPVVKLKLFLFKENGVMVKMLGFDSAGKEIVTIRYNDIKINPKIDPDRFVFKAPAGVQVLDMTNQ